VPYISSVIGVELIFTLFLWFYRHKHTSNSGQNRPQENMLIEAVLLCVITLKAFGSDWYKAITEMYSLFSEGRETCNSDFRQLQEMTTAISNFFQERKSFSN
jgi:heme/copper-type cytochrome/quinol oxidase subunit 2